MINNRAKQLEKLSMQLPQANADQANARQAARTAQLQQTISQTPNFNTNQLSANLAADQIQKAGQIQTAQVGQNQQARQRTAQSLLGLKERKQQQTITDARSSLSDAQRKSAENLAKLDINIKNKLLDDQLNFKRNEDGTALMNIRQLVDFAASTARTQEEFANYAQHSQQVSSRKMQILQQSYKVLSQTLSQGYIKKGKKLDRETRLKIIKAKTAMEEKISKEKNKAENRQDMFKAGLGILKAGAMAM